MAGDNLLDLQWSVLAGIIVNPASAGPVLAQLGPEDFTSLATKALHEALVQLHRSGVPMEMAAIKELLGDDASVILDEAGRHVVEDPTWYAGRLREYRKMADIKAACYNIAGAESLEDMQRGIDKLNGLDVSRSGATVCSAYDMADLMMREMDDKHAPQILRTGLWALDDVVQIEAGDFVLLGGYPSAGKTALALQMATYMARSHRVGFYSLETGPVKAARRLLASMAGIPLRDIKSRTFTDDQCNAAAEAFRQFANLQFEFVPSSSMSVRDIQSTALSRRHEIVFVDYLQIIQERGRDRYEIVTNISQGLHRMAQDHGIVVIALAQLTRPQDVNGKRQRPTMASFRESGQIEQDADVAMLLYLSDPDDYKSPRELKIAKNKEGQKSKLTLAFDGPIQRFSFTQEKYKPSPASRRNTAAYAPEQMEFRQLTDGNDPDFPF